MGENPKNVLAVLAENSFEKRNTLCFFGLQPQEVN